MRTKLLTPLALLMTVACTEVKEAENPFFSEFNTPFGIPPFEQIEPAHYMPAFEEGMEQHSNEIAAIVNNQEPATFANTIAALDNCGDMLNRVALVFYGLTSAETNDALQNIAKEVSPLLSEHSDEVMLNQALFERVKEVYDNQSAEQLTVEEQRLLENTYKGFVRSGALLSDTDKEELMEINKELSMLSLQFGENLLAETNAYRLEITNKADLAGLPQGAIDAAALEAGEEGKWVFTLKSPSITPFLQFADNRDLREQMYKAYVSRCDHDNEHDNKAVIAKTVNLRVRRAHLLGYNSYADFVLAENMAKNSTNVHNLMMQVWEPALAQAKVEVQELQGMIDQSGETFALQPWDWSYYAEKLRKAKYDISEEEIKPYLQLENVRKGAFEVAHRLYGITFEALDSVPLYHPDVTTFEVKDADGSHLGVLMLDYFPRAGKSAGAWMSNYQEQYIRAGKETRPIVYNVGSFTKPTATTPSLLTQDEALTLFHEFGHGLHGLLTQCNYRGVSGTNVARDFVELPSQIMERWAFHPDVLKLYAKHYQTGEDMPKELIEKMERASKFNQGFATTEFLAAGLLDMEWHSFTEEQPNLDVRAFEKETLKNIGLIPQIGVRYRSPYFSHIFDGGYAVGYYSYLWAEVLEADAFDYFVEKGIFDPATAASFRHNILERGSSEEPMTIYRRFRGAEPNAESLLKKRGLL